MFHCLIYYTRRTYNTVWLVLGNLADVTFAANSSLQLSLSPIVLLNNILGEFALRVAHWVFVNIIILR